MTVKQLASILVVAAASAVAHPLARRGDVSLADWSSKGLESYWTFHVRYNSLNCAAQRDTPFYESCCYPLAADESLDSRPPNCTPANRVCNANLNNSNNAPNNVAPDTNNNNDQPPAQDDAPPPADNGCQANCGDDGAQNDVNNDTNSDGGNQDQPHHSDPQPDPAPAPSNPGNVEVVTGGIGTWYEQEGTAGACGHYFGDYDLIAAMDTRRYGNEDAVSSLCGKRVHITNERNGRTVEVIIADACPTCQNSNSIDLSLGAFQILDDFDVGVLPISWYFMD